MYLTSLTSLSLLLALTPSALVSTKQTKAKDAVLLSNVRSLTLQADKPTSHRRVSSIPQLTCVGGSAKGLYHVDVMRCRNSGSEYDPEDIQWTCQASLPPEFKLGSTEVVCEGYDSPDDPYILKGSCGVEYRLVLTNSGEEKYGMGRSRKQGFFSGSNEEKIARNGKGVGDAVDSFFTILFWVVFITVLIVIAYKIFCSAPDRRNRPGFLNTNFGGGGGGGGGGFDDHNDPPPPYTPRSQPKQKTSSQQRSAPRSSSSRASNSGNGGGWRPGFWTGAAAGAAGGYYAGSRHAGPSSSQARDREWERQRERERDNGPGLFSFFGGGGGGQRPRSPGPSSPGPSSSRYESSGFGGTRRR